MRFYLFGPRLLGIRPGISFSPQDLQQRSRSPERLDGSFVYVVKGEHNMVKIGVTTNPAARIAQLRTGSAFPLSFAFIGCTPGNGLDIEREAHAILARQRCAGEWFDVSPELATSAVMGAAARLKHPMLATDERRALEVLRIAATGNSDRRAAARGMLLFLIWAILSVICVPLVLHFLGLI